MPIFAFLKKHHSAVMTTLTVLVLVGAFLINLGLGYLFQENLWYSDTTPEGLYTPTKPLLDLCGQLKGEVTITFCAAPDRLLATYETRYVYYMAKQLENKFHNIHVVTYDIAQNPTAVDPYRATSNTVIEADDVIISSGGRYRIYTANSFWTLGETSSSDTDYYSFDGEYKMATAFLAVTSVIEPVVCFAYGHGESYYVPETDTANAALMAGSDPDKSTFYDLMRKEGLRVVYINLDTQDIPEDCVLLVMDGPTVDYSARDTTLLGNVSAFTRMHEFMMDRQGALMVFKDPDYTLPNLEDFMGDWGIGFQNNSILQDMTQSLTDENDVEDAHRFEKLIVDLIADDTTAPYVIYQDIVSLATAPRTIVERTGSVYKAWLNDQVGSSGGGHLVAYYYDFFYTSQNTTRVTLDGRLDSTKQEALSPAALTMKMRYDPITNDEFYSYCFGAATTSLTDNTYLANRAYSNYDILFSLVRHISRTDEYASLELGGTSLNSDKLGGKPLVPIVLDPTGNVKYDENRGVEVRYAPLTEDARLAWTIVLVTIPLLAAGFGIVWVTRKRNR